MKSFFKWLFKKPDYRFGEIYAHEGDIFACENCGRDIYKFNRDVFIGEVVEAESVSGVNGYDNPKSGNECECPNCGAALLWM